MRGIASCSRSLWLVVLVLLAVAILANLPSQVQVGQLAERAAEWWHPTRPRVIEHGQLGPKKRAILNRLKARSEAAKAANDD